MMSEKSPEILLSSNSTTRLHELDGLRVCVFGLLILYHTGMLYVADWGFHYKSQYQSEALANLMLWSNQWRMSLLFLISGAALALFLPRNANWPAMVKRLGQLLLPLLFGMLVVVVPQVYVEANSQHIIDSPNFWHFWYIYLDQQSTEFEGHKTLGSMHLTWNHLWYLPYLFVYTLLVYLLMVAIIYPLMRTQRAQSVWHWLSTRLSLVHIVIFPIAGFYINGALLYADNPVTHNLVQDWFNHGRSLFSFLLGFVLIQIPDLWRRIKTIRWQLLIVGLIGYGYTLFAFHGGKLGDGIIAEEINGLLWSANSWLWILCVIAWGQQWFTQSNPLIRYLNSGVFCFYILHQTLIIVFAYWLTPLTLGGFLEPVVVIGSVILSCWILFELIKPIPVLRAFFGINDQTKTIGSLRNSSNKDSRIRAQQ